MGYYCYKIPSLSQMLTTDPGDSEECYACKLLEVLIIHCHHSLMQMGGTGSLVGEAGSLVGRGRVTGGWGRIQMGGVMSQ